MRDARTQSQEIGHTNDFLTALSNGEIEQEKPKSAVVEKEKPQPLPNGKPKLSKVEPGYKFSDPPAPPPSQPLPEKPDSARSPQDLLNHPFLRRTETEKPKLFSNISPTKRETSGEITNLIEALSIAKKQLDSQATRVKQLEEMLIQERNARENAEAKARRLESSSETEDYPQDLHAQGIEHEGGDQESDVNGNAKLWSSANGTAELPNGSADGSSSQKLQQRLDLMVAEMDEMKQQMEGYRSRARTAEEDSKSARKSLEDMVEQLRRQNANSSATKAALDIVPATKADHGHHEEFPSGASTRKSIAQNGTAAHSNRPDKSMSTALARTRDRNEMLMHSAPYASMLGVVVLGVSIMAYLNGWHPKPLER